MATSDIVPSTPFYPLLTGRQTRMKEKGMDGHFLQCHLLFSTPSERKTDRARFERDGWSTPTWAFYSFLPLLKDRQAGLGESGMGGQLLHEAVYAFLLLLKERHTGPG